MRVGFNSIGAGASVNHLHFQFWRVELGLPVESAPRETMIDNGNIAGHIKVSKSAGWYSPFFVWLHPTAAGDEGGKAAVELRRVDRQIVARHVACAADHMTKENLPHNLVFTPKETYLFPRRPSIPFTPSANPEGSPYVTPGFPEMAGAIIAPSSNLYAEINEAEWVAWFAQHLAPSKKELDQIEDAMRNCDDSRARAEARAEARAKVRAKARAKARAGVRAKSRAKSRAK